MLWHNKAKLQHDVPQTVGVKHPLSEVDDSAATPISTTSILGATDTEPAMVSALASGSYSLCEEGNINSNASVLDTNHCNLSNLDSIVNSPSIYNNESYTTYYSKGCANRYIAFPRPHKFGAYIHPPIHLPIIVGRYQNQCS